MQATIEMAAQAKGNYQMLKEKLDQVDLKELLRPHFFQLLEQTIDPVKLALILVQKNVMSKEEMQQCMNESIVLYQNLELYKIVMKKNAGVALIDALEETENFNVLQLLLSIPPETQNQLAPEEFSSSKLQAAGKHVAILRKTDMTTGLMKTAWTDTIGEQNLARLDEDNFFWTLARVATTSDNSASSRTYSNIEDLDSVNEPKAILLFLESTLELDQEKKTVGRRPLEIYINTGRFNPEDWEQLSKLLYNFCRDSLENLWLDCVDFCQFSTGTKWMTTLKNDPNDAYLWFTKLQGFIVSFHGFNSPSIYLKSELLHQVLTLIKPDIVPLQDLWNFSGCQIQIGNSDFCQILMDPARKTLYLQSASERFTDEIIFGLLKQQQQQQSGSAMDESRKKRIPVEKLYYLKPSIYLIGNIRNPELLTHLFLDCRTPEGVEVVEEVLNTLGKFKSLQKLGLRGGMTEKIKLRQLSDVLVNLSLLYLQEADVDCGGRGVNLFPWRPAVQMILLQYCGFELKSPERQPSVTRQQIVMLKLNQQQTTGEQIRPCVITELTRQEAEIAVLNAFFN